MKTFIAAFIALTMISASASAADTVEGINSVSMTSAKTLAIAPGGSISIVANDGDVMIRTWQHNKVAVRSEAVHETIIVTAQANNGDAAIQAKGYTTHSPVAAAVHVIYVPVGSSITIQLTDGELTVDDPDQSLQIQATSAVSVGTASISPMQQ